MDYNKELKLLYALDFGQRGEIVFRLVGILLGSGIIYAYTGWWESWLWAGMFAAAMVLYFLAHRRWDGRANASVIAGFHVFILVNSVLFVWMPVKMIAYNDTPLSLCGVAILGCFYVFMMRQLHHALWLVIAQFLILAIASGAGVAVLLSKMEMYIAMVGLIASWLAFNAYFVQTVLQVRKDQQQARLAAERSAQSSKMEALGQMAGGVAHDFNNILTAAMGNLELAQIAQSKTELNDYLKQAHISLDRAAVVIRELLQFARPSSPNVQTQSSADLLAKLNAMSKRTLPNSIALVTEEIRGNLWVSVDENQFMTAMMNLMINASQAAGSGARIILSVKSISLEQTQRDVGQQSIVPGQYVQFSVTDDGPGVPPEIVSKIIEPFFTTKLDSGGTGLGLPMVQSFAHQLGGGLTLSSRPGETRFCLLLPQKDAPVQSGKPNSAALY